MTDDSYIQLVVPAEAAGQSLAELVIAQIGHAAAQPVFAHQGIWQGGRRVSDPHSPAQVGAELVIHRPPGGSYSQIRIGAADICYEDAWLLALNKQPGWYTTPTPWDVHGNVRVALTHWLRARDGAAAYVHLTHQLDRDTSGVLLCTRTPELNSALQDAFASGSIQKDYLCICTGEPAAHTYTLETGHGRGWGGRWRLYPRAEVGRHLPNGKTVKYAATSFRVLRRLGGAALLHARLHTGRTHQIRLHLAELGHPLLGDDKYGGALDYAGQPITRHLLHAAMLRLTHPVTGQPLRISAPLPVPMAALAGTLPELPEGDAADAWL